MNIKLLSSLALALVLGSGIAFAGGDKDAQDAQTKSQQAVANMSDQARDAWLKGKVEMALLLNRHLNSFRIDTHVDASLVTLSGEVESDIDRDLAEQIALGIDGVKDVKSELAIEPMEEKTVSGAEEKRRFLQRVEDLTLTARVKSKLLLNSNIKASKINVDTANAIVTLEGEVSNGQERDLAIQITQNTGNVAKVNSRLKVRPAS